MQHTWDTNTPPKRALSPNRCKGFAASNSSSQRHQLGLHVPKLYIPSSLGVLQVILPHQCDHQDRKVLRLYLLSSPIQLCLAHKNGYKEFLVQGMCGLCYNFSVWENEAGRLGILEQSGLHNESLSKKIKNKNRTQQLSPW